MTRLNGLPTGLTRSRSNKRAFYALVGLATLASLLQSANWSGSAAAEPYGPALTDPVPIGDFGPKRNCTASNTEGLPRFSGTGAGLVAAVNALPSNSTLVIDPASNNGGEYVVTAEMAITGKSNITICAAPGTRPRIKQTSNVWRIFTIANSANITIEGLEIYSIYDAKHDRVSGVQALEGAHHVRVWDMWVHDVPACGICSARSFGHNDFRYNRIWNTAAYSRYNQSGISIFANRNGAGQHDDETGYSDHLIGNMVWASRVLISRATDGNCIIIDNNNDNGDVSSRYFNGSTLIANNLCVANGGRGIHVLRSDNVDVVHNTLYHNLRAASGKAGGLDQHQGELDAPFSNNTRFVNNLSVAVPNGNVFDSWSMPATVRLAGNLFNGPTDRQPFSGGFTKIDDPAFQRPSEDPRGADFRPQAAYVKGDGVASFEDVLIPSVDFSGLPRSAETPTPGAFEP